MTKKPQKAYSYIRFSTPEQAKGDSEKRQMTASAEYCRVHGLELDTTLKLDDKGVSAYQGRNRTEGHLAGFLKLVEAGEVKPGTYLLVESLDRLSRERVMKAFGLFTLIVEAGIKLVTLADGQVYDSKSLSDNPGMLFLAIGTMMRAHEESATKSKRLSAAWVTKRENAGNRKLSARCPGWLRLSEDRGEFLVIPERAKIVKRIFQATANGIGRDALVRQLNRDGVPPFLNEGDTRKHTGWQSSYISKMTSGKAVLGEYQPHKMVDGKRVPEGVPVPDYFPAVIDVSLWERANAAKAARLKHGGGRKGPTVSNLFSGLVMCVCGSTMQYRDTGKGRRYLACYAWRRGVGCKNRDHFRYAAVEDAVLNFCFEIDPSRVTGKQAERNDLETQLESITAEITTKEAAIEKFMDLMQAGGKFDQVATRIRTVGHEVEALKKRAKEARKKLGITKGETGHSAARMVELAQMARKIAKGDAPTQYEMRSRLAQELRRVVTQIEFSQGRVTVHALGAEYEFETRGGGGRGKGDQELFPIRRNKSRGTA